MVNIPKPHKKRFYRRWWFWFLIVLVLVIASAVWTGSRAMRQAKIASYQYLTDAVVAQKRDVRRTISTNGQVVADQTTTLSFALPVKVDEVKVAVGDEVNKDAVLVKAGAQELVSPFDGRITALYTFDGDQTSSQKPLVEISYKTTHIQFFASDSEALELVKDQRVNITVPSYHDGREVYTGEVTFVDVQKQVLAGVNMSAGATSTKSGYRVKISASNLPAMLANKIGLSVDLEVIIAEQPNVIAIDLGAVQYNKDHKEYFVYLVPTVNEEFVQKATQTTDITSLLETKKITIGFRGDNYAEVVTGLAQGDRVLLYVPAASKSSSPFF